MIRSVRRALVFMVVLVSVLFAASRARAEGAMYVANEPPTDRGTFPLTRTDVKSEVSGELVSTTVTQRFENPHKERIEAVYVFPLPVGAAVDDMEMRIGTRVVRAEPRRRAEAQASYDAAARSGRKAALLEQERPNVFTFSVANIDPGGAIEVKLHYFEIARYDAGTYEMVFPMVVGPRYIPGTQLAGARSGTGTRADTNQVPDASRISPAYAPPGTRSGHTIGLSVHLAAGTVIESLDVPTHDVVTNRLSTDVKLSLKEKDEIPNRDFVMRWRLAAGDMKPALFAYRDRGDDGYFTLLIEPKHDILTADLTPRELVFLLDTSGSMHGAPLATVKDAIGYALERMHPSDTFTLIDFADSASTFSARPLPNSPTNVARAKEYLANLRASGGTNQLVGINAALTAPHDPARLRYVMFMTDGYIGNEKQIFDLVQAKIGDSRIFGFGVGSSVNRYLLDEVSFVGRGTSEYILPNQPAMEMVERFYARIAKPFVTDIHVDWGGFGVEEVYPRKIRDLSALEPLAIHGRYKGKGKGAIVIHGTVAGKAKELRMEIELPEAASDNVAISRVWAREKIRDLSREPGNANEREITRIALAHRLVSQYTSLLAIDAAGPKSPGNALPTLVNQPSEAPAGVNLQTAGGTYATPVSPSVTGNIAPQGYGPPPASPEADQPIPPPPAPGDTRERVETAQLVQAAPGRGGGCGACTVGEPTRPSSVPGALFAGLVAVSVLLSRRGQKGRS